MISLRSGLVMTIGVASDAACLRIYAKSNLIKQLPWNYLIPFFNNSFEMSSLN